jgi:PKD domain
MASFPPPWAPGTTRFRGRRTSTLLLTACALAALTVVLLGSSAGGLSAGPSPSGAGAEGGHLPAGAAPVRTSPEAPTPAASLTLSAPGTSPAAVSLSWTPASVTGLNTFVNYTVAVSAFGAGGPFRTLAVITSATTTEYAAGSLAPGGTYWWQVTGYVSVFLGGTQSQPSNVLEVVQPTIAYLTTPTVTSTSVTFDWTNNATYGGLLSFRSYAIYLRSNGGTPTLAATVSSEATLTDTVTGLSSGTSYSFFLNTTDCLGCATGTPTNSSTTSNTVTTGTVLTLSASVAASRSTVDANESDLFACTPAGGESPFSFAWSIAGGGFSGGNSSFATGFSTLGSVSVTCRVTDHLATQAEGGTSVLVNPDPKVSVRLNRTAADVGEPIAFNCSQSGGTPAIALAWTFGDGAGQTGALASHAYATARSFVPTCTATDGAGVSASASQQVLVSSPLSVTVQASRSAAAPGTPVHFTAVPANGSGGYSAYTWTFGDQSTGTGVTVQHAYSAAGNFTVSVRVTDSNGITASGAAQETITPVVAHVVSAPTSGAPESNLTFSATASGGAGGPYNFTWNFGDGSVGYGASVLHAFASSGTFSPTLKVTDGAGESNTTAWPSVTVAPPAAPGPALGWLPIFLLALIGAAAGAVLAVVVFARRRATEGTDTEALSRWVPPVGPKGAVSGSKLCPKCGASNAPMRRSCQVCGASLPRSPRR